MGRKPLIAISIKQPFVELILQGKKKREYRSMPTNITGRVYLYASLKERPESDLWRAVGRQRGSLPTGVILGTVEIVKCVRSGGGYAYVLRDPKPLKQARRPRNLSKAQPRFWWPEF